MKKYFYSFFAAVAMMLAVTSCSQEDVVSNETSSAEEVEVSFNIAMEGQNESRAIGDGLTVNEVIMNVFSATQNETTKEWTIGDFVLEEKGTVDNHNAVVKTHLVKGQAYAFVFWAQVEDNDYYSFSDDKTTIIVNYNGDANDEKRDAFYAYEQPYKVTGSFSKNITLKRPFAQLNLGTTAQDIEYAKRAGVVIAQSSVKVEGAVYNQLNTLTGNAENAVTVQYTMANIPNAAEEDLVIDDKDLNQFEIDNYEYLASDYLLANESSELSTKITYVLLDDKGNDINTLTIENAPLQRNWRTNIVGEIITGEGTFNIVIDPIFDADRNYPMDGSDLDIWDGTKETPTIVNKMIVIEKASQFLGLSDIPQADLNGVTIELKKDLSFKSKKKDGTIMSRSEDDYDTAPATIEPLFTDDKNGPSNITFLGNDHVIRDFIIDDENGEFNSLFGTLVSPTISNLTIINADVKGAAKKDHYASILVAKIYHYATIDNVTIKDSKLEGIQKIGGLIGFITENYNSTITNCTVDGLTLSNIEFEDEAGSTGGLIGAIVGGEATVENCYVNNSILNLIQGNNEAKRANSEFIGVIRASKVELVNCGVEGNTYTCTPDTWTAYYGQLVGGNYANASLKVNGVSPFAETLESLVELLNNPAIDLVEVNTAIDNGSNVTNIKNNDFTFNMNENEIKAGGQGTNNYAFNLYGSEVVVNDANLNGAGFAVLDGSNLTVNSGKIAAKPGKSGRNMFYVVGNSEVTVNEGIYTFDRTSCYFVYVDAGSTCYINGGHFEKPLANNDSKDSFVNNASEGKVIITGGTFNVDPTKWLADGYKAVKSGKIWTVSAE